MRNENTFSHAFSIAPRIHRIRLFVFPSSYCDALSAAASPKTLTLNPGSIDRTPCRRVRALVAKYPRQALLPHSVITVQRRKTSDGRRNANRRKTRERRRGGRPPVIHRKAYPHPRPHLLVH